MENFNYAIACLMIVIWAIVIVVTIIKRKGLITDSFILILLVSVLFEITFVMSMITKVDAFELYPFVIPAHIFTAYLFILKVNREYKRSLEKDEILKSNQKVEQLERNIKRISDSLKEELNKPKRGSDECWEECRRNLNNDNNETIN